MRIIPARAGPTNAFGSSAASCPDHPRACGANQCLEQFGLVRFGSSPRVRGQQNLVSLRGVFGRIIPARAGPTMSWRMCSISNADHPRACGANSSCLVESHGYAGSSPRVRGQQEIRVDDALRSRIIPARAGPTTTADSRLRDNPDHPRACGANSPGWLFAPKNAGSSPRVRGQRRLSQHRSRGSRIIPARAGPTRPRDQRAAPPADHPRACGANMMPLRLVREPVGSSPRVRGQLNNDGSSSDTARIIPARAGPTTFRRGGRARPADHPRACGANPRESSDDRSGIGSSPRVRGQLTIRVGRVPARRIIPARAGPTLLAW